MPSQRPPRADRAAPKPLKAPKKPKTAPKAVRAGTAKTRTQAQQLLVPPTGDGAPLKLTDKQIQVLRTLLEGIESKAMEHVKQNSPVAPPPHPKGSLTRFLFTGCLRLMAMGLAYGAIMATTAKFVKAGVFGEVQLAAAATIATIVAQVMPAGTPAEIRGVVELAAHHAVTSLLSFHRAEDMPRLIRIVAGQLNRVGAKYAVDAASAVAYSVIVMAYNVYLLKPQNVWWTRAWLMVDGLRGAGHLVRGWDEFKKKVVGAAHAEQAAKAAAEAAAKAAAAAEAAAKKKAELDEVEAEIEAIDHRNPFRT